MELRVAAAARGYPVTNPERAIMTNPSGSHQPTDQTAHSHHQSREPKRRAVAPGLGRPRVPGASTVAGAAAAGAGRVARGARAASASDSAQRGRAASSQAAGAPDGVRGPSQSSAARVRAPSQSAASGVRRPSAGAAERGRAAAGHVARVGTTVVDTGGAAAGEVTRRTAPAAEIGRTVAGEMGSAGSNATQGVLGAVGSTLRAGTGTSLSFLVARALLLLRLIQRLAQMALLALRLLTDVVHRWTDRAATATSSAGAGPMPGEHVER